MICGVDGCKKGWMAIFQDLASGKITWACFPTAQDLFFCEQQPQVIAIDIPIGLPDFSPRACDHEARQTLGRGRASSVFAVPLRSIIAASTYREACELRFKAEGKKVSKQSFGIFPKTQQVDATLRANIALQNIAHEVHPEVCFHVLNHEQPLQY